MVNELATGYVSIVAETSKMGPAVAREFAGIERAAGGYGRAAGTSFKKGFQASGPVDVKELEQRFSTAEKSRAATAKRTTTEIEGLRRREAIAQAQLTEAEAKYAAGSSQVLRAKDRLATASQKVQLAEAKQSTELGRADAAIDEAKRSLDAYTATTTKAGGTSTGTFRSIADKAAAMGRGVGASFADAGRGIGGVFRKLATGDVRGALSDIQSGGSAAASGVAGAFQRVKSVFSGFKGLGSKSGQDTGRSFSEAASSSFKDAASKAGSTFKSVLGATLAASGITKILGGIKSAISGAFGGGFDRVMNIEQAESKLATLAKAAGLTGDEVAKSVKASMSSVSDAVDGTKFAISDAADMASQLGAAGVESGKDMTRWLSLTADAAQFSGREFSDMQRTISKVVAEGKVTGETFQELPLAAAALAKSLNIPQEEVRKLASEGKISSEQFAAAMEGMIGGAAKNAGESFLSLRDNIKSALNASMAKFIEPVTDAMKPIMGAGLDLLKGFRDQVAGPLGKSFGDYLQPKAEALATSIGKIPGFIAGVKSILQDGAFTGSLSMGVDEDSPIVAVAFAIRDALQSAQGGITAFKAAWDAADGEVTSSGIAGFMERLGGILRGVFDKGKDAVNGFVQGFGGFDSLLKGIGPVLSVLMGPLGILKSAIMSTAGTLDWSAIGQTFGATLRPIVDGFVQVSAVITGTAGEIFAQLLPVLGQLAGVLFPALSSAIQIAVPVVVSIYQAVAPLIAQLVSGLAPIITTLVTTVIPPLLDTFKSVATLITSVVVPVLSAVLGGAIKALMPVVSTVFGYIGTTIKTVLNVVSGVIKTVTSIIKGDWSGAWEGIKQILSGVWGQMKNLVDTSIKLVRDIIGGVVSKISSAWSSAWDGIKSAGKAAWDWISSTVGGVFTTMRESIERTFSNMSSALGRIWGGIKDVFRSPINAVIRFINDGIIGGYNWVASKFGMKELGKLSTVPAFRDGGMVDLPWSAARRDPYLGVTGSGHAFRFEGEEFFVNRASTAKLEQTNPGLLDHLNRFGELPGHAGGGRVSYQGKAFTSAFVAAMENARALFGRSFHISQGGFRPRTSYSGTSHQGDAVDITSPVDGALIAALRKSGIAAWDRTGKGAWAPHIHGVPLPGFGSAAGSAVWQAQDYLRGGDGLGGRDNGPRGGGIMEALKGLGEAIAAGFNSVREWFGSILDKVAGPFKSLQSSGGGGVLSGLVTGIGTKLKDDLSGWVKETLGIGAATGTMSARRGPLLVGEREPEYLWANGREAVIPASQIGSIGAIESGITRLSHEDLDYLIRGLVAALWPTARAADIVNDLATNGQSRARRGVAAVGI